MNRLKLPRRHKSRLFIVPMILMLVGFIVFVRNSFSAQAPTQTVNYIRSGPYDSAGWSVFTEYLSPISVTANNTGVIPQVLSLSGLTGPLDAAYHQVNGWHPPTGWFWDADNSLLYVLSVDNGTHPVMLSMVFPLAASSTVTVAETVTQTVTATETMTVTVTNTVTSTVVSTSTATATVVSVHTVTVSTTTTTIRTCTIVCLP